MNPAIVPSSQPDLRILSRVHNAQTVCFIVVGLIAGAVLCGWLVPAVGSLLPRGWSVMKSNTALAFVLMTTGLVLMRARPTVPRLVIEGRLCAIFAMSLASAALFAYATGTATGIETIFAADSGARIPGRMSVQTGVYLEVLGLILVLDGAWRKPWVYLVDALAMTLLLLVLSVTAGYVFQAAKLFGENAYTRVSPQTLTCMMLMGFAVIGSRTRSGFFSVLAGDAIGSQSARITLPFGLVLPFLIVSGSAFSIKAQWLSAPYAAALAASMCSGVIFVFVVLMARRINELERGLRNTSLLDELTRIYNRRAFYLLGERALLEARRDKTPLTVLFFDLNGLKTVNDSLGHEIGSQLLVEAANLLRATFRNGEVVARVGGDEFAVVTHSRKDELIAALKRLDTATAAANSSSARCYRISYSMGEASIQAESTESFGALVDRADTLMYGRKRKRKVDRDAASAAIDGDTPIIDPEATGALAAFVSGGVPPMLERHRK